PVLADLMMDAIATVDAGLLVFVTSGSEIQQAARRARLKTLALFPADRAYDAKGRLVARGLAGAIIKDEASVRARVRQFL
ncbi:LamB/YcsF family protein, partial [Rhizobium johnstonii]|uniref:LamB/YcsF family protein n=1 Tax=Rhizobium johnstonii TaxID=3019933 RepID=UPI003F98F520